MGLCYNAAIRDKNPSREHSGMCMLSAKYKRKEIKQQTTKNWLDITECNVVWFFESFHLDVSVVV
jgi:hypothetical protein